MIDVLIVTPTYNDWEFLPRAINSVFKANTGLRYKHKHVIVDNASDPAPAASFISHAHGNGCEYIRLETNGGPARARNVGVAAVPDCRYVLPLDAYDELEPDAITYLIDKADRTCADVVYGNMYETPANKILYPESPDRLYETNSIFNTSLIRQETLLRFGGWKEYNGDFRKFAEDWNLWLRMYRYVCRFQYINRTIYKHHLRESSLSNTRGVDQLDLYRNTLNNL